uniref:Protein suppressor of forked n=1 Tax=Drosophila melanogaster TaxID=7227 RepID=SUF_DROME|nr:suppressor of forked, isoform F [Drosophila melanogaster]P25991.2 RecName: Full=Protein suppressor of forked [Drosophila melanogaster]EAA46199.3 suppressor of forked, isoform F [Drosophila melanogaster]|eukprot:NP_001015241.3 suppressor of forked, isoform F [Drosophila melanogaster]
MSSARDLIKVDIEWGMERLVRAQQVVELRPYDIESWSVMIREAQTRPIHEVRSLYESLVNVFPTTARYWKLYIEMEMRSRYYERVEKLFQRCLVKILNIDLWKLYLTYVKETKSGLSTHKEKMAQAYDFALEKIGMDLHSFSIWQDYIYFLRGVEAVGNYAENQKITAVRRVYQKAVVTPIVGIEQLWKDYIAFEQNINPIISEKMSLERSKDYMNARRVAKELEYHTKGLNRNLPAVPPTLTKEEVKQVELWKRFITYEKSNPLRTEDTALVTRRVMFATEQCLLVLTHHPAVWHQASQFLDTSARVLTEKGVRTSVENISPILCVPVVNQIEWVMAFAWWWAKDVQAAKIFADECANILERSINGVLNRNALLYFAYADFEEGRLKYEKVHTMYNKLLQLPDIDPTLVYVQYMKFARRAEGIKSARSIFKKAREDVRSRYHIFVAAALMEYYCSKDKEIAFRIFELGLKRFGGSPEYVMCYIDYLSHLNEDNNTRVLFERVLSSGGLSPHKSVEVWNRFLEFESNIGDLSSIVKVERRRSAVFENLKEYEGKETAQLVDRYKFLDLYPCTSTELKSIGYAENVGIILNKVGGGAQSQNTGEVETDSEATPPLPRPDFSQMIPFKPRPCAHPGAHPLAGGVFPQPPALAALCATLPPPNSFRGPFVSVELLFDIFMRLNLPDSAPQPNGDNELSPKIFDLAKSVHWIVDTSTYTGVQHSVTAVPPRRRRLLPGGDDSDDELQTAVPPSHDIYRLRQLKRFAKSN